MVKATVNCDASFCADTRAAGWAVWISIDGGHKIKRSGKFRDPPANSGEAEFWAALNGLWLAAQAGVTTMLVQSDCQQALAKVANEGDLEVQRVRNAASQNITIRVKWVKGHSKKNTSRHWVNNWCDEKAKRHMRALRGRIHRNKRKQQCKNNT